MNKKGGEDSLCKASHSKCFKTANFDRFQQIPSRNIFSAKFLKSDYAIDNVLVCVYVCVSMYVCMYVKLYLTTLESDNYIQLVFTRGVTLMQNII